MEFMVKGYGGGIMTVTIYSCSNNRDVTKGVV